MSEEVKELIQKVAKGELPKEAIPKPVLIEDLGLMFATEKSKIRTRFGIYRCGFCGTNFKACISNVKIDNIKSCGCYRKNNKVEGLNRKHNLSHTRIYNTWGTLKDRVFNIKNKRYSDYGGRGITICDEWKNDFMSFYNWAMSNGYSDELSIDRIDNNGNYEPSNCRWVTYTIQNRNQRIRKDNKTGYKGVCYNKDNNNFRVVITVDKERINLGRFKTAVEGAIVFNNYIIENNLEGFVLNEIPEEYLRQNTKEGN